MNDITVVVTFIGQYIKSVLKIFLITFILFLLSESIMLVSFFSFNTKRDMTGLTNIIFSLLVLISFYLLTILLQKKARWNLNLKFHTFFMKEILKSNKFPGDEYDFKKNIKKSSLTIRNRFGIKLIPPFASLALSSPSGELLNSKNIEKKTLRKYLKISLMTSIKSFLASIFIYLPFFFISYFFSISMGQNVKILIYASGILFFLIIKVSIVDTLKQLLIKKKFCELFL